MSALNQSQSSLSLRIVAEDANFSRWHVFLNELDISASITDIFIEMKRGCLPLITIQCTANLNLPERFTATIEAPKRLHT